MTGKTGIHPDCRNSSNPYHECSEFCFKVIADQANKLATNNQPAGFLKAETTISQPTSVATSAQADNEKSEPNDHPQKKYFFELRLKMNEARKANQSAIVAEKKRILEGLQESRGMKWMDERKKRIGKLFLEANELRIC